MADRDESCWILWSEIVDAKNADPYIRGGPIISRHNTVTRAVREKYQGRKMNGYG